MVFDTWRWPEELLDGQDVVTARKEVGREGMAEGVASGALVDAGRADSAGHGALHNGSDCGVACRNPRTRCQANASRPHPPRSLARRSG